MNDELRQRKKDLGLACANGQRGRYLPPIEFFNLKGRIDGLKRRSQQLQIEIGAAREAMKGPNPDGPKSKSRPKPPGLRPQSSSDLAFEVARQRMEELHARKAGSETLQAINPLPRQS